MSADRSVKCKGRNRILIVTAVVAIGLILGVALFFHWFTSSYGRLSTYDITVVEREGATVSRAEFLYMLCSIPETMDCPRFRYLEIFGGPQITLTPTDVLVFFLYSGDEEAIISTRETYQGKPVSVTYHGNLRFSAAANAK